MAVALCSTGDAAQRRGPWVRAGRPASKTNPNSNHSIDLTLITWHD